MVHTSFDRPLVHPGEILLTEFLEPMELTQRELAQAIHVPYQRVNDIVRQRRGVTPSTALRLAKFLGTTADFWMGLQARWDLKALKPPSRTSWNRSNREAAAETTYSMHPKETMPWKA